MSKETDRCINKLGKGKLIVFEGVDAVGKSTLCNSLCNELHSNNIEYDMFSFPGKIPGDLGELVYRIHHNHEGEFAIQDIDPLALQSLHVAAHIDLINRKIKKSLSRGHWVVLDRFYWSTYVYGLESGIPSNQIKSLVNVEQLVWNECSPDLMVYVDADTPLRDDELPNESWNYKRQLYSLIANDDNSFRVIKYSNSKSNYDAQEINTQRANEIISIIVNH